MLAEERRLELVDIARREGRVDANKAANRLDVAVETIRRDLDVLQRQGLIRRVHGGAISTERALREDPLFERRSTLIHIKNAIAQVAATYLPKSGSVFVDGGTSAECLVPYLSERPELTVITNSLTLAAAIGHSTTPVILAGGRIRSKSLSMVGELALESLRDLHADIAFIGANGVDLKFGLTTMDTEEASIKRFYIENSLENIVLVDHSKFGKVYATRFAEFSNIDRVITDIQSPTEILDAMKVQGTEVVVTS